MIIKKHFQHKISHFLIRTFVLFVSASIFIGCSTPGYVSEDLDGSLSEIQKSISDNLPTGVGHVSSNQRSFYSKEFTASISSESSKTRVPAVMRVLILGDRRPYSLQILVNQAADIKNAKDAFENGVELESSETYAHRTFTSIKDQLSKRLKNKNLFDDFRPF